MVQLPGRLGVPRLPMALRGWLLPGAGVLGLAVRRGERPLRRRARGVRHPLLREALLGEPRLLGRP
ncbi:hypothetical protein [Actinosynnema mirum]|nr:hypothetical protein [Actinosynnema mirum]